MTVAIDERSLAERRRDASREAILEAAWEACRNDGLGALSLRDLAGRVGLKAPSLYAYFESKSAIYDAMFKQGYEQLEADRRSWGIELPTSEPRATFKRAARRFMDFCTSDPVRYQLMFQRVIPDFAPSPEAYAVSQRVLAQLARDFKRLGITEPTAVDLWTAISTGLADQQISNDPGGDRWARLIDTAVDLFCDHVGIPRKGARK